MWLNYVLRRISEITVEYLTGLWHMLIYPNWNNFLYGFLVLSLIFLLLEVAFPWRKEQVFFRKDFWLDTFYMFFNLFIFPIFGFEIAKNLLAGSFNWFIGAAFGLENIVALNVSTWPGWIQLILYFVIADFMSFNVHRLLHRVPLFWEFHKVHHSIEEMGYAAHLRYHWMENILYTLFKFFPLALIGFDTSHMIIVHLVTIAIGHYNHANFALPLGPLKYIFNNPQMHIWHHAKDIPKKYGVNFGISLSIWDYLFRTDYIPHSGRDIELGFEDIDKFPKSFWGQLVYPLFKRK